MVIKINYCLMGFIHQKECFVKKFFSQKTQIATVLSRIKGVRAGVELILILYPSGAAENVEKVVIVSD